MVKIMVCDDSGFMRKILKSTLQKEGYDNFVEGTNGEEAIEIFKKEKPDLVLLDIIMEKKDGVEALKEIMKVDPKAKVIMVTAVGQEQMVKEAMASGAKDYIVKPFQGPSIVEKVKAVLG